MSREMFGRRIIESDAEDLTDNNILDELKSAMAIHNQNRSEIDYLWKVYKGKQAILGRQKKNRPEICNRIVVNRANEIVSFKVGYLCGEPIQYVGRSNDESVAEAIAELNEIMFSEKKASRDKHIIEWNTICGTAYRMVLPHKIGYPGDSPFELFKLDPRNTFVVYSTDIGGRALFGVKYYVNKHNKMTYHIYSANHYWKIEGNVIVESKNHALGMIPIIEYPANEARLGAFEIVLPLLDTLNNIASNRMDGIEQFIQSFMKFVNCDISSEDFEELKAKGAIKVKSVDGQAADVDIISAELDQTQTQTFVDDILTTIQEICGMPNRNGGASTSDTGAAVLLRDGWSLAEARAKDSELMFKESEMETLKLVLRICRDEIGVSKALCNLTVRDIDMKFTRRNYDNIQSKSQVLTTMLAQEKIHPRLAFTACGLFSDPENAYQVSKRHYDSVKDNQSQTA